MISAFCCNHWLQIFIRYCPSVNANFSWSNANTEEIQWLELVRYSDLVQVTCRIKEELAMIMILCMSDTNRHTSNMLIHEKWPPFSNDISNWFLVQQNVYILIKILLKFELKDPIDTMSGMVRVMAWRQIGTGYYFNQSWRNYTAPYCVNWLQCFEIYADGSKKKRWWCWITPGISILPNTGLS